MGEVMGLKARKKEHPLAPSKVAATFRKFVDERHKGHTLMVVPGPVGKFRFLCLECELAIQTDPLKGETKEHAMNKGWP